MARRRNTTAATSLRADLAAELRAAADRFAEGFYSGFYGDSVDDLAIDAELDLTGDRARARDLDAGLPVVCATWELSARHVPLDVRRAWRASGVDWVRVEPDGSLTPVGPGAQVFE